MEYYSAIKRNAFECILVKLINLEPIVYSKSEREKPVSYINAYTWHLERSYRCTYLQGSSRDADIQNRLMDAVRQGKDETNWESSTDTYTLPYAQ